jgi:sterol desaturase/sphingolipid hydroxylase (fatty acid hydroxylase superfamily)
MVLFPPVMLFFFLGAIATPLAAVLFLCVSANTGWLFVVVAMGYFLTYEVLHFAYHLHPDSWVWRLPFMAALRRHHTRHHDLALMGRYNFNITFPICDRLFGTTWRDAPAGSSRAR